MAHFIGELSNQKETAPIDLFDPFWRGGIRNSRGIETLALVLDDHPDQRVIDVNGHLDTLRGIQLIAVDDGVRQRLAQSHPYLKACRSWSDATGNAVARDEVYGFFDDIEIGGDSEADLDPALRWFRHPRLAAPDEQAERSGGDLRIQRSLPR